MKHWGDGKEADWLELKRSGLAVKLVRQKGAGD